MRDNELWPERQREYGARVRFGYSCAHSLSFHCIDIQSHFWLEYLLKFWKSMGQLLISRSNSHRKDNRNKTARALPYCFILAQISNFDQERNDCLKSGMILAQFRCGPNASQGCHLLISLCDRPSIRSLLVLFFVYPTSVPTLAARMYF